MMFRFSQKSLDNLKGVHPILVDIVHDAMAYQVIDFSVVEGVRTLDRQKSLVASGKSRTMLSKHLIQSDGYGHAVDLFPSPVNMDLVNKGNAREIVRFGVIAGLMFASAKKHGTMIVSGMDWDGDGQTLDHTFFDAPHFQIVLR